MFDKMMLAFVPDALPTITYEEYLKYIEDKAKTKETSKCIGSVGPKRIMGPRGSIGIISVTEHYTINGRIHRIIDQESKQ